MFREATRSPTDSHMPTKSLELKHTIKLIREVDNKIEEIEAEIKTFKDEINSPYIVKWFSLKNQGI